VAGGTDPGVANFQSGWDYWKGSITSPELVFSWKTACIGLCGCITSKERRRRRRSGELEKTKVQGAGAALSHMTTQQVHHLNANTIQPLNFEFEDLNTPNLQKIT
jgi:hypothetical protein